jgi:lysophospholipase L1-like esterase
MLNFLRHKLLKPFIVTPILLNSMIAMGQIVDKTHTIKFLALGDSYTIGESVSPLKNWPSQLVDALRARGYTCEDPQIIATTGWRTDDLKRAIDKQKPAKNFNLVSLLIGVNNQYQGKTPESYAPEFEELLKIAVNHAGGDPSKVFVVSIPDYGYTPFGKDKQSTISVQLEQYNSINKTIAEKHHVKYVYITDISMQGLKKPDLVADDGLHPSAKMYTLWVERILKALEIAD